MDVLAPSAPVERRVSVEPETPRPLLPPLFASPAIYLWLWALPVAILLALNAEGYWVVSGNMDPAQHQTASILGVAGVGNMLAGVLGFVETRRRARRAARLPAVRWWWGVPAVGVQTAYLWLACTSVNDVLPQSVTTWIYPPERFLFNQFAFAMLPLFVGVIQMACAFPLRKFGRALGVSVGMAVGAPLLLYMGAQLVRFTSASGTYVVIAGVTTFIVLGIAMFVGVIRGLMLLLRLARDSGRNAESLAIVALAIVLPYAGLALNGIIPFPVDFQAWEVYALVAVNAAILLLASWKHADWPRLSFNLLGAAFPFSLYFFIVLLPYTPLSIIAVVFFGLGFLVLTPTFLFALHVHLLNRTWTTAVAASGGWKRAVVAGGLCFLVLPAFFVVRGLSDRAALHEALDYVFTPSIARGATKYTGSRVSLRHALAGYRSFKDGIYYPMLSDFYNWVVFDNLVLPDDKVDRLEQTFFGTAVSGGDHAPLRHPAGAFFGRQNVRDRLRMPRAVPTPHTVEVAAIEAHVRREQRGSAVCTLVLTLRNTGPSIAEYEQSLALPAGVFVNGFRLHMGGVPVPGRIFERKTALWVYTMIRDSQRRDPGLLVYNRPNEVDLRVFPVTPGVLATVEVDFLLPGGVKPTDLPVASRDPAACVTALTRRLPPQATIGAHGTYFAAGAAFDSLPRVERTPYLHLIVDRSEANGFQGDLRPVAAMLKKRFPLTRKVRVTFANSDVVDAQDGFVAVDDLVTRGMSGLGRPLPLEGGCATELAIAHALCVHRDADLDTAGARNSIPPRPVVVILEHKARMRPIDPALIERWSNLAPELQIHELGEDGSFVTHRSSGTDPVVLVRCGVAVRAVTAGVAAGFPEGEATAAPEYWSPLEAAWRTTDGVERQPTGTPWAEAAQLILQEQDYARSPGSAGNNLAALVKASRETGILLPVTSYIAVENEAQWRTLELSERRKLGQNAALEFRETPAPPALVIAGAFFGCLLVWRWRRRVGCALGLGRVFKPGIS